MKFHFSSINLGCTKNLVDTQFLLGKFFSLMGNPSIDIDYIADPRDESVDYVFLNTCGFLSSGRAEMMEHIQSLLATDKKVYVLGCAVHYFKDLLTEQKTKKNKIDVDSVSKQELAEWNALLSSGSVFLLSWKDLETITVSDLIKGYNSTTFDGFAFVSNPRAYTNAHHRFEYIKIAEGCNNQCSFCIIPKIRGRQISRPIEAICEEIGVMVSSGIEEIVLIAQDSTRYGVDLYGKPSLFDLLEAIEALPGDFQYRVLYLYPDIVSLSQIKKLATFQRFIPYFDIPLQHISEHLLKRMGRFYNPDYITQFLETIVELFPVRYIRTNFIIGFPGETRQDNIALVDFIKQGYFDNIALFEYHDEPLAPSSKLDQKVDDETIRQRFLSAKVAWDGVNKDDVKDPLNPPPRGKLDVQKNWGYIMDIDEANETLTVRPWLHAPEIDPYVTVGFDEVTEVLDGGNEVEVGTKVAW